MAIVSFNIKRPLELLVVNVMVVFLVSSLWERTQVCFDYI